MAHAGIVLPIHPNCSNMMMTGMVTAGAGVSTSSNMLCKVRVLELMVVLGHWSDLLLDKLHSMLLANPSSS